MEKRDCVRETKTGRLRESNRDGTEILTEKDIQKKKKRRRSKGRR